jgi:hypothetical protein
MLILSTHNISVSVLSTTPLLFPSLSIQIFGYLEENYSDLSTARQDSQIGYSTGLCILIPLCFSLSSLHNFLMCNQERIKDIISIMAQVVVQGGAVAVLLLHPLLPGHVLLHIVPGQ